MNKNSFNISQIRQIIEKTIQVSNVNNGVIPISKLEDAAEFASYIAGYSSWKQYRKEQKKETKFDLQIKDIKNEDKNFKNEIVNISTENLFEFKENLKKLTNKKNSTILKENKQIIYKINAGKIKNKITKSNENIYLNTQNTCFVGFNNFYFLEEVKNSLNEQLQCVIEINSKDSKTKLDPINEIFSSDCLESFLGSQTQDHKDFIFIWSLLIKQLLQQYNIKFTVNFLKESLELDFILKFWVILSQENNFLGNMIISYIKSLPGIKLQSNNISVSKDSQEKHWENIKVISNQLDVINLSYEQGVFSYEGIGLLESMQEKKSIEISIPLKTNMYIYNLLEFMFSSVISEYLKQVEGLDSKEHAVFIVNKNENLTKIYSENDYVFSFLSIPTHKNEILQNFNQIIFTKHKCFVEPSTDFIKKFYLRTKNISDNIFLNSGQLLIDLKEEEAYLWQLDSKETSYGFFTIQKINN